jgi:hypothetical protein
MSSPTDKESLNRQLHVRENKYVSRLENGTNEEHKIQAKRCRGYEVFMRGQVSGRMCRTKVQRKGLGGGDTAEVPEWQW